MKTRTALSGLLQVNVKRILFIWLALRMSSDFVGRAATSALRRILHRYICILTFLFFFFYPESKELYFNDVYNIVLYLLYPK